MFGIDFTNAILSAYLITGTFEKARKYYPRGGTVAAKKSTAKKAPAKRKAAKKAPAKKKAAAKAPAKRKAARKRPAKRRAAKKS